MARILRQLIIVLGLAAFTAAAGIICVSKDPAYTLQAWSNGSRFWSYDALISQAAARHGLDPMLIKAVIWRESGFHPEMVGTSGERGLMQVSEAAAQDWATAQKVETFVPTDLFDAATNIEIGAWYLSKALARWRAKADPVPFALAEYNAGGKHVSRWVSATKLGEKADAEELLREMDFPTTRRYVEDITRRYHYYQALGHL